MLYYSTTKILTYSPISCSTIVLYSRDIEGGSVACDNITQKPASIVPHNNMTVLVG